MFFFLLFSFSDIPKKWHSGDWHFPLSSYVNSFDFARLEAFDFTRFSASTHRFASWVREAVPACQSKLNIMALQYVFVSSSFWIKWPLTYSTFGIMFVLLFSFWRIYLVSAWKKILWKFTWNSQHKPFILSCRHRNGLNLLKNELVPVALIKCYPSLPFVSPFYLYCKTYTTR